MPKINPDLRDESSNHDIVVYQPFGTFSAQYSTGAKSLL
jgi:hypothetical protein